MAKEWILNIATNRWGLNKKDKVGPVALWIRECSPKNKEEWEYFYYQRLKKTLNEKGIKIDPKEYITALGQKLYIKITEVMMSEIEEIEEQHCIDYIKKLIIDRTYEGYKTEVDTIYGQLQKILGMPIKPAPDQWDRLYNIDFYIEVNKKYIGIQIKPITYEQTPEIHKWKKWISKNHKKFEKENGGKAFIVFSVKKDGKKSIYNPEVIEEISREIRKFT